MPPSIANMISGRLGNTGSYPHVSLSTLFDQLKKTTLKAVAMHHLCCLVSFRHRPGALILFRGEPTYCNTRDDRFGSWLRENVLAGADTSEHQPHPPLQHNR